MGADKMNCRTGLACCIVSLMAWAAPAQAALIYDFQLNGSYTNAVGADSISPNGGSLGATGYTFGANQGLSIALTGALSVYTIKAAFHLDAVDGYRKIIDFKNLASDDGLYTFNGKVAFFPIAEAGPSIAAGEDIIVTLSRDAAGTLSSTLNGVQVWTTNDSNGRATGFVNYVQVYDTATVPAPVPEPATWAMMIGGFALAGAAMRRRTGAVIFT
jgi:hypothetical protein